MCTCLLLAACDDTLKNDERVNKTTGTLILNNGTWGENDSNICIFNADDGSCSPEAFYEANGQKLGDLGQDILKTSDEVYIAMSGSQTIFVTGHDLKIKRTINAEDEGNRLSPRAFATDGENVYVSCYEGFVGEISQDDYSLRLTPVGPNPEGLDICGGKLYVADSGGMSFPEYNNTVSIVSLDSFSRTGTISVNVNPARIAAYGDLVYIFSYGDYAAKPSMIQVYDTTDGSLKDLEYTSVSSIAEGEDGILYILCGGYDENWNPLPGTVLKHDMKSDVPLGEFVTDGTKLPDAYSISVASDGNIYVGCSDYVTTGEVCVFDKEGRLLHKVDSHGFNPITAE